MTKDNVGKTWKQSINLSSLGDSLPGELKFTLTAMELETDVFGEVQRGLALSKKLGRGDRDIEVEFADCAGRA